MKKPVVGILLGIVAGFIDVTPMIIQKLTWDANISAFSMWIIIGFLISTVELKINSILKGIIISYLVLIPCAILIAWKEPKALIPIFIITTILGALLGFSINKITSKQKSNN